MKNEGEGLTNCSQKILSLIFITVALLLLLIFSVYCKRNPHCHV